MRPPGAGALLGAVETLSGDLEAAKLGEAGRALEESGLAIFFPTRATAPLPGAATPLGAGRDLPAQRASFTQRKPTWSAADSISPAWRAPTW